MPPAFELAGVNLHTWTGFGSVPYWNAYVAATEMNGSGVYFAARLKDPARFPVAARSGSWDTRGTPDKVTAKLAALHFYQLAIPAPQPPAGSFDDGFFRLGLTKQVKNDLVQHLLGCSPGPWEAVRRGSHA